MMPFVNIMHECSGGEYLAGAAWCMRTTHEHEAVKHHAVLKG